MIFTESAPALNDLFSEHYLLNNIYSFSDNVKKAVQKKEEKLPTRTKWWNTRIQLPKCGTVLFIPTLSSHHHNDGLSICCRDYPQPKSLELYLAAPRVYSKFSAYCSVSFG